MLTTKLKSFDTFLIIATKSSSITLSLTGIDWIVIPMSTSVPCGLTSSNYVIYEIVCRSIIGTINNLKNVNKLLNLLIRYTEAGYKTNWSVKVNINLYVVFSVGTWTIQKINFFLNKNIEVKKFSLTNSKLNFNLDRDPRTVLF